MMEAILLIHPARTGVITIVLAICLTPFISLPSYDWIQHTTSELGAQSTPGAWLMNLGFAAFGLGTLLSAIQDWPRRRLMNICGILFGLGLIGAGVFSTRSIDLAMPFDAAEDTAHSFFATFLGFAFAGATAAYLFGPRGHIEDVVSWTGLVASVALPLLMLAYPLYDGVLQRLMFTISFVWVWRVYSTAGPTRR